MSEAPASNPPAKAARLVLFERFRLVAACLIVVLHTGFLADVLPHGYLMPDLFGRIGLPYFAVLTGYFLGPRAIQKGPSSLKRWVSAIVRVYAVLFPLYAVFFVASVAYSARHYGMGAAILGALNQIFFTGYAIHLWYLPSVVYALFAAVLLFRAARGATLPIALAVLAYVSGSLTSTWSWIGPASLLGPVSTVNAVLAFGRWLFILFPYVVGGIALARHGDRIPMRAAWVALILGFVALVAESIVIHQHGRMPETMLAIPVVVLSAFRLIMGHARPDDATTFPYGPVSSLVYYFHMFPLLVLGHVRHPMSTVFNALAVAVFVVPMILFTMRTRLSKLLT